MSTVTRARPLGLSASPTGDTLMCSGSSSLSRGPQRRPNLIQWAMASMDLYRCLLLQMLYISRGYSPVASIDEALEVPAFQRQASSSSKAEVCPVCQSVTYRVHPVLFRRPDVTGLCFSFCGEIQLDMASDSSNLGDFGPSSCGNILNVVF